MQRRKETEVDASPAKSSKSIGVVLKRNIVTKTSTTKDIKNTNDSLKPTSKTNISLISSEYVENYTDESLAKYSNSKGVVLKNNFLPKATTSKDINITKDSRIPTSKPNLSLIPREYGENDVDEVENSQAQHQGMEVSLVPAGK